MNLDKIKIFIISSPSGGGKTKLSREILKKIKRLNYSISYTTRRPRKGEVNGLDYYFVSEREFVYNIYKNNWLEWALVHGNFYGTIIWSFKELICGEDYVLLDIDTEGARSILNEVEDVITIFLISPSFEILENRLLSRGSNTIFDIKKRLYNAKLEIKKKIFYHYLIINDKFEITVKHFINIFKKHM